MGLFEEGLNEGARTPSERVQLILGIINPLQIIKNPESCYNLINMLEDICLLDGCPIPQEVHVLRSQIESALFKKYN